MARAPHQSGPRCIHNSGAKTASWWWSGPCERIPTSCFPRRPRDLWWRRRSSCRTNTLWLIWCHQWNDIRYFMLENVWKWKQLKMNEQWTKQSSGHLFIFYTEAMGGITALLTHMVKNEKGLLRATACISPGYLNILGSSAEKKLHSARHHFDYHKCALERASTR